MNNVISLQEYKDKKNKPVNTQSVVISDVSPEFQERLLRISMIVRNINETLAALDAINTKREK